jgi:Flp pilus assembly protein TadB
MGPITQDTANGAGAPHSGTARTASADGRKADWAHSLRSVRSPASPAEARLNERLARVLGQKRGPDAVITGVLCAALLFGLIGLAAHFLWIVAIILMALGLGYTVANSRRDRIDVIHQQADGHPGPAPAGADLPR